MLQAKQEEECASPLGLELMLESDSHLETPQPANESNIVLQSPGPSATRKEAAC